MGCLSNKKVICYGLGCRGCGFKFRHSYQDMLIVFHMENCQLFYIHIYFSYLPWLWISAFILLRKVLTNMRIVKETPARIDSNRTDNKLRVAAYCRVSSDHEEQKTSLEAQISNYSKNIESYPEWISAGVFGWERGSGLSLWQRAEFMRMMGLAQNGEIDLILTKSISRFGRMRSWRVLWEREH